MSAKRFFAVIALILAWPTVHPFNVQAASYWNRLQAERTLNGTGTIAHHLSIPGADSGRTEAGDVNNFFWGMLDLSGQRLGLMDSDAASGGALYGGEILRITSNSANMVTDITGKGLHLYYPLLLGDAYLNGHTFSLEGNGQLAQSSSVPWPSTLLLMGTSLLGIVILGWRRKDRCN
jgi:hypothetical protein